jgi:uncharacterized protein YkwD
MTSRSHAARGQRAALPVALLALVLSAVPARALADAEPAGPAVAPVFGGAVAAGQATASGAGLPATVGAAPLRAEERDAAAALVALVNAERQAQGLAPLQVVPGLATAAQQRALEIDERLSHVRPAGSLNDLFGAAGVDWQQGAENLAYLDGTATAAGAAQAVHRLLMNSPSHRRNLLAPEHRYLGIGVHLRAGRWFVVQLFAG